MTPVSIMGVSVNIAEDYKYLVLYFYNSLDWTENIEISARKTRATSILLGPLTYEDFIRACAGQDSAILFAALWWGSRLREVDADSLIPPECISAYHWKSTLPVAIKLYNFSLVLSARH